MAGSGTTQQSIRKALGAIKDSTTVGLAKVNSDYKDLDVAIVKATNHVEHLAKEKHLRVIFHAVSASRPRADVAYCLNVLARRLAKTHNWAVALKTLIIIHRALREVDPTFREELINYSRSRGHMLNLSHFKDDSSPKAWDYSAWVRTYALYLEERLECLRILKYDVETERTRTSELDTIELLEQLPALQQLLFRLLSCKPEGAAMYNNMIQHALSIVAGESIKIHSAINSGTLNLVDKFFEMQQRHDALRALEIYRKAGVQAEQLSEFHVICKSLDIGRGQEFTKIEQPPISFISAMEEYVKDAAAQRNTMDGEKRIGAPKPTLAIEHRKLDMDDQKLEGQEPTLVAKTPELPIPQTPEAPEQAPVTDLLGFDDISQEVTQLEEKNAMALTIVNDGPPGNSVNTLDLASGAGGWELALVGAQSSNGSAVADSKLAGGFDKLTLDSLYDAAIARTAPTGNYHLAQVAPNPFGASQYNQDPFFASNTVAPPANVQMATMAHQQVMMQGQTGQEGVNPFGNPFGSTPSYPTQNPYTGFM